MPLLRPRLAVTAASAATALVALTACGGSSSATSAADAGPVRSVATAYGDVSVPEAPQRVLALGETALDTTLAVGIRPVGALAARGGNGLPAYLADLAGDVPTVGTVREPDLEAVVAADPDLILAGASTTKEQYDLLAAVAPTVVPPAAGWGEWEAESRVHAAALGRGPQVETVLTGLEQRAQELAAELPEDTTASVVRWMPEGPLVMSGGLMAGRLLEATGAELPAAADFADKPHTDPLSLENLAEVDADWLYVATLNADGEAALEAARESAAFSRLEAVEADRVVAVDGSYWSSAAGPLAAERVLDDIEAARS